MEIVQGQDDDIELFIYSDGDITKPVDLTDSKIMMTVKRTIPTEDDSTAVLQYDITEHEDQLTKKGYSNIHISREDSLKLAVGTYWFDIWLITDYESSPIYTQIYPASKLFVVNASVTRRDADDD
jgi:hypothetical protein